MNVGYGVIVQLDKKIMNRLFVFLFSFFATFVIGSFHTAHSVSFQPLERQKSTNERGGGMKHQQPKAVAQAWVVFLPFQNAPGPGPDADIDHMSPFGKPTPPKREGSHQSGFRFDRCLDTDMCLFIIPGRNSTKERKMLVELFGIDVPHLRATCEQETALATNAMELLQQILSEASQIEVYDHYKVGAKHMARVVVDGQDLSELLLSQGFAALRGHEQIDWCTA